jgi:hypothetical protein
MSYSLPSLLHQTSFILHLKTTQRIPSRAENWDPQRLVLSPRSVYLTSFDMLSLMSYSSRLSFSVAKFTIKGVREGADSSDSAPPRLSSIQTPPDSKLVHKFPINPFSLSRSTSSFPYSHTGSSSSINSNVLFSSSSSLLSPQNSADFHIPPSVPAHVSSVPSPHIHTLFPNPFLIKRDLDPQPATPVTQKTPSGPPSSPTINISVQHNPKPDTSATPLPHVPSVSHRKPRKPRPDRVLVSSPF